MTRRALARAALLACGLLLLFATPAFAYDEPANAPEGHSGSVLTDCMPCHRPGPSGLICTMCHVPHMGMDLDPVAGMGPHGLYTATTDRCEACHAVHDAGGADLLPAATVSASCGTCHDGTGGRGVYGTIEARTGVDPSTDGGMHAIDVTGVVPGGDATTGGSVTVAFGGPGATLSCDDCHSPHDSNTVAAFTPERWRTSYTLTLTKPTKTSHLLKKRPGAATVDVAEYGSDWCAACHAGRASGGVVHNHPVDLGAGANVYDRVVRLDSDDPTGVTVVDTLALTNRGYLMPYPRTAEQGTHKPICQQCHEDTRSVGTLTGVTGDAEAFVITTVDGQTDTDNPRFQNFPHETVNPNMLVETHDDLCLNCHPITQLP